MLMADMPASRAGITGSRPEDAALYALYVEAADG